MCNSITTAIAMLVGCCFLWQMVDVLGEECEGWWKGTVVGKKREGVFPNNFVELLPKISIETASSPGQTGMQYQSSISTKSLIYHPSDHCLL